ncbi:hypothetical protein DFP86_10792 [Paludibacterium purpuratum]|uniref:YhcG N-terminal domain-containing protein n=1 Tax=Paludibacterium purpuratum TaxID=1144873 RepID=A0A4R7B541_9NEIS|nr:hypothetical protein DFP86_10792 [Paludibacterium purpuratum]
MRFVEAFPEEEIVKTLSGQLSWSHFLLQDRNQAKNLVDGSTIANCVALTTAGKAANRP